MAPTGRAPQSTKTGQFTSKPASTLAFVTNVMGPIDDALSAAMLASHGWSAPREEGDAPPGVLWRVLACSAGNTRAAVEAARAELERQRFEVRVEEVQVVVIAYGSNLERFLAEHAGDPAVAQALELAREDEDNVTAPEAPQPADRRALIAQRARAGQKTVH